MSKEMTAVEYLKTKKRMCKTEKWCDKCPMNSHVNETNMCALIELKNPKEVVAIVQKWAEEHPLKTRQSEFLKLYPNAAINDGAIKLCPRDLNVNFNCRATSEQISCNTCRKEYWLKEVEK